jgi:hypothetical protein
VVFNPEQNSRALARDQALARIGRARRWIAVGAAALTAAIAALVSAVAPGRSLASKKVVRRVAAAPVAEPKLPPIATAGDLGLQAPGSAPSASSPSASAPSASTSSDGSSGASAAGSSGSSASSDAAAQAAADAAAAAAQAQTSAPAVSGGS